MGNTRNLFLNNEVTSKNPFNIFTDWYENANQICDAHSMYLTTVSKTNSPSCRMTTCIKFSKDGFQFPVTDSSQTSLDLKENVNAALAFIWPQNRAVKIEGVVTVSEDNDDYAQKLAYNSKIIATCSKMQQTFESRESLMKSLDNLKLKYPLNSNIDCNIECDKAYTAQSRRAIATRFKETCGTLLLVYDRFVEYHESYARDGVRHKNGKLITHVNSPRELDAYNTHTSVFILIPETIEFYQSKKGQMQERLQFKRGMDVDNNLVYKAEEGWTYVVLSP